MKFNLPPNSRILAVGSGLLMFLALPPINLFFLAWIGLVPLWMALEKPFSNGFGEGFAAGLTFNTGCLYWLFLNSGTTPLINAASFSIAVFLISLGWGIAAWSFCRLRNRYGRSAWILVPFMWAAWEGWLSYFGELAFPWPLLALTQTNFEAVLQVMEFTGIWGVSFWVVAVNVVIFFIWKSRSRLEKRIAFTVFAILIFIPPAALISAYRYYRNYDATARLVVAQGCVDPLEKWTLGVDQSWAIYDSLTRESIDLDPDLVIWPETAMPLYLFSHGLFVDELTDLANEIEAPILTGASGYARIEKDPKPLNCAFLIEPDRGIVDEYSKQYLVPFGERVPFQWLIPALSDLNFGQAEFLPGHRATLFQVSSSRGFLVFPALICFESAFPQVTRNYIRRGANLLVTISNDAWFGKSSEPYQIAALSRFRCIETRRSMARAANTGISFLADPLGRVVAVSKLGEKKWLIAELPLLSQQTFFVRHGDLLLLIATALFGLCLLVSVFTGKRETNRIEETVLPEITDDD